jgi:hypothetical protein
MGKTAYAEAYRNIDFRAEPHKYKVGKGEQGVLIAEPYKSEILPHWQFATPELARESATAIYAMFKAYGSRHDFVGMDMARKFLQMGFTRARRYANHASGRKYAPNGTRLPQDAGSEDSPKAKAARIFYAYYKKACQDTLYNYLRERHEQVRWTN